MIDDHACVVTWKRRKDRPLTILVVLRWHKSAEEAITARGNEKRAKDGEWWRCDNSKKDQISH